MDVGKNFGELIDKPKEESINIDYNPDNRIEQIKKFVVEHIQKIHDPDKRQEIYNSTEEERIAHTPLENTSRGKWNGERGNGEFIPNKNDEKGLEVAKKLSEYGEKGITYREGIPDFSKCSIEKVEIAHMTEDRSKPGGNFEQADTKLAEQWNNSQKDGRTDWTAIEARDFRRGNKLTWHECSDMKTCMLIDREIHKFFIHTGGVSEYKKGLQKNDIGGIFDE